MLRKMLEENRKICLQKRNEIRGYGVRTFDISNEVSLYIEAIEAVKSQ